MIGTRVCLKGVSNNNLLQLAPLDQDLEATVQEVAGVPGSDLDREPLLQTPVIQGASRQWRYSDLTGTPATST